MVAGCRQVRFSLPAGGVALAGGEACRSWRWRSWTRPARGSDGFHPPCRRAVRRPASPSGARASGPRPFPQTTRVRARVISAQAIGRAAIQQGYRVIYREAHAFLEELAEATLADTRKAYLAELTRVPLLIIDDLGMRKLLQAAAYRRRGPARADHAPLRAGLHHAHLESSRRGLGKAPRRHRRRHGATRPAPASRTCAQVRTAQLAHQGPDNRLASNRCRWA